MVESGKRMEQLKSYLRRLSEGEILDSVRADFMREFKDVDAVEIMEAEQRLQRCRSSAIFIQPCFTEPRWRRKLRMRDSLWM